MIFNLKQYDKTILTFSLENKYLEGQECKIIKINQENINLLPIGVEPNSDSLFSWIKSRVVPKNREFVSQILSKFGLASNDTIGILKLCKGLSLNDSYWIVEHDEKIKFQNYNLFDNSFSRTLSLIAYTGYGSNTAKGFTSSPEFTTNGMLRKCWRRINKKIYLYKGGTSGGCNTGNEPYSEFYASQIAKKMGVNAVSYNLTKWKNILCSTCELFTDINHSFVPIYRFVKKSNLVEVSKYLKTLGKEYYDAFVDMLVFDAVILNTDRHSGNYGLIVDNKTNKPVGFAPVFDNGNSLFSLAMPDEINEKYAKYKTSAFDVPFDDIVKEFITNKQREKLRKLLNFKFEKHQKYNLPSKRILNLENFVQFQVKKFLNFWLVINKLSLKKFILCV